MIGDSLGKRNDSKKCLRESTMFTPVRENFLKGKRVVRIFNKQTVTAKFHWEYTMCTAASWMLVL